MPHSRAGSLFVGDIFATSDKQTFESPPRMQSMSTLEMIRLK